MKLTPPSKLDPVQASTGKQSTPSSESLGPLSAHISPQQKLALLNQLDNSWAKVISSQKLSDEQNQRVLMAALNGLSSSSGPASSLKDLMTFSPQPSLLRGESHPSFYLIKLNTQLGKLNVLSDQSFPQSTLLQISRNKVTKPLPDGVSAPGQWRLIGQSQTLQTFATQHLDFLPRQSSSQGSQSGQYQAPQPPITGSNPTPSTQLNQPSHSTLNSNSHSDLNQLTAIKPLLKAHEPITLSRVINSMALSGVFFENQLAQQSLPQANKSQGTQGPSLNLQQGWQTISAHLQNWKNQFQHSQAKPTESSSPPTGSNPPMVSGQTERKNGITPMPSLHQDFKLQLMHHQQQLINGWLTQTNTTTKTLDANQQALLLLPKSGQTPEESVKSLFELLLSPKSANDRSIWPKNLSVQSQIHKLLQQLVSSQASTEAIDKTPLLLKQALEVSNQLMRLQGEQIHNRLQQSQNPDTTHWQISVPYQHDEEIHWCQLEIQHSAAEQGAKKEACWHLLLRFEQEQQHSFAVETQMRLSGVDVLLWSKHSSRLQQLSQHAPLLKDKLQQAGFQVESIHSKHGLPPKKQPQLQQSLVDLHT